MADQVNQHQYPSPDGATVRAGGAPVYHNGDASGGADVVPQLHALGDDNATGFNIDPNLQPHAPNHAQQLAQGAMNLQPDYGTSAQSAAESAAQQAAANALARSKTSRACDECRRKKIRCDGSGEMEMGACSACKRSGHACAYSRTPQKRGPNRGYIRELTQRVETLERERQGHQQADGSPSSPAPPVPSQDVTFFGLSELGQASPAGYPQTGIKRSLSISADESVSRAGVPPEARTGAITLSPALLSSYYAYLHPNFPFLPADGEDINLLLSQGQHASVRAFMQAFEFCMHSVQYTGQHTPNIHQLSRHLYDIYNGCKWEDPANILQLYTALLLVVESINRGTSTYLSRAGQDPWIYMRDLVSMAITHNLFVEALQASTQDENGFRRLSLCITVLDTFLAFANRKEGLATAGCEVGSLPRPEDKDAFGYRLFELNRITRIIRQLQDVQIFESPSEIDFQAPTIQGAKPRLHFGPQDVAILRTLKAKDIELLQSIQLTFNYSEDTVVGMAFWYARILVELHYWPEASASALLYSCRRLIEIFATLTAPNIYTHHFSGLAAHTLFQLCDFSNTKEEAIPLLDILGDTLNQLVGSADSESFDAGIRNAVERKRQSLRSANLEHLAAVAVGNSDGSGGIGGGGGGGGGAAATGGADHSVAEAAAAAAQAALGSGEFTGAKMSKEGYLTAVLS